MKLVLKALLKVPLAAALVAASLQPGPAAALTQDAYVWQRNWSASVSNAVSTLATNFGELIVLRVHDKKVT